MTSIMNQAARFGVVGMLATIVHVATALALVAYAGVPVFWANIGGFCCAVMISYVGNHRWTFSRDGAHWRYFPRFISVAVLGLAIGQAIVWGINDQAGVDYRLAVLTVALVVPAFGFVASRVFAFAEPDDEAEGASG